MNETRPYRIEMDDGYTFRIVAESAAQAVGQALDQHRGHCAKTVYCGGQWGSCSFDVPPHKPLTPKEPEKPDDGACSLFDDKDVKRNSQVAWAKAHPN